MQGFKRDWLKLAKKSPLVHHVFLVVLCFYSISPRPLIHAEFALGRVNIDRSIGLGFMVYGFRIGVELATLHVCNFEGLALGLGV
jgi:hypothetical protein